MASGGLRNIHLVPETEDDIYQGYEDFQTEGLEEDPEFQRAIATQQGRSKRPPTSGQQGFRNLKTGMRMGTGARLNTGFAASLESGQARPITSTGAAGFSNKGVFDPFGQTSGSNSALSKIPVPPLDPRPVDSPEEIVKQLEIKVSNLLEESTEAADRGDNQLALDKAKEASRKERVLCKERDKASLTEQINLDLTYGVLFNLATQYHINKLYTEALNTYLLIVKNKLFGTGGKLRVNMGNVYYEQQKYPLAIKNYRMALDQIPDTHRRMRFKILENICTVFVKMGQYNDAINTYEHIHNEQKDKVDYKTAMNLLMCYYALGDKDKLKRHFQRMTLITAGATSDDDHYYISDESDPNERLLVEVIKDDTLQKLEKSYKHRARHTILRAAELIAPIIESTFASGFDWCIEVVKSSQHSELANELEITKALTYLKENDTNKAIDTLKECGRKDTKMSGAAATNLSFVYYLQGDIESAEKYADVAIQHDHYNPHGKFTQARDYYKESLSVEATCSEALFNLGLTYKKLEEWDSALECFNKMQTIFKNLPQVLYNIADIYDKLDDFHQATEWYLQLITLVPTDPGLLQRLGEIYDNHDEKSMAYQYYYESFRYCPSNIDVISWLGAYYMESHYVDKAVRYFEKAALIQPTQVKWRMMIASCHRKTGNYQLAYQCYQSIHRSFPDNVDCLKFLYRLSSDLGLKEANEYSLKLRKAEKQAEEKRMKDKKPVSGSSNNHHQLTIDKRAQESSSSVGSRDSSSGRSQRQVVDDSYVDPLGSLPERPRTGFTKPTQPAHSKDEDDFNDDGVEDLLPE